MTDDERARCMAAGRDAFDRGNFFQAHEIWEGVWMHLVGDERRWVQGLIQVAAGRHQLARGRTAPAARLLARALDKLGAAPEELDGIDVAGFRAETGRILAALAG